LGSSLQNKIGGKIMEQIEFDEKFSEIQAMFKAGVKSYQFKNGDDVWANVGSVHLDNFFTELATLYIASNDNQRSTLYEYCGRQQAIIENLWYYIRRVGKLIESKDDKKWLELGIACSLIDGGRLDYRDTITSLILLRFAAERKGIETHSVFDSFIQSAQDNMKKMLENVRDHPESSVRSSVQYFGPPEWKTIESKVPEKKTFRKTIGGFFKSK
jgi:hypothetical protein